MQNSFMKWKSQVSHIPSIILSFFCGCLLQADIQWLVQSPVDYQVFQRNSSHHGEIKINGSLRGLTTTGLQLQYRWGKGAENVWVNLPLVILNDGNFDASVTAPAGGWYELNLRVTEENVPLSQYTIPHVGIGEIFVVAGQSNSANHGAKRLQPHTGKVSSFDGIRWQLAKDPQPGASGNRGSFIPPFGDEMCRRFQVPIGIVSCGIGATSVREWLPKNSRFPNPPTLTGRVKSLPDGEWASDGEAFNQLIHRIQALPGGRFRALLWHQGESDANQKDPTRTLPGKLYREYLENLIDSANEVIGWPAPWFVAQVSYHNPGDESSPDIRLAQASLWSDGIALQGPDTDTLKGHFRDNNGQGVHFSQAGLLEHGRLWAEHVGNWLNLELKSQCNCSPRQQNMPDNDSRF